VVWGAHYLYIKRNVEKVLGARYTPENTVLAFTCVGKASMSTAFTLVPTYTVTSQNKGLSYTVAEA
jgi:hypothetical protein